MDVIFLKKSGHIYNKLLVISRTQCIQFLKYLAKTVGIYRI